jgi:hypothetical protein
MATLAQERPLDRNVGRRDFGPVALIITGVIYVLAGLSFCYSGRFTDDRTLVSLLLLLSTLFCWFLGVITYRAESLPWSGLVWALSACEFLKSVYLLLYFLTPAPSEPTGGPFFGFGLIDVLAIVFAVTLSLVAFYLISCMVKSDHIRMRSGHVLRNLVEHLGEERLLGLSCFLVVFLYVTYFLGFALAFHDRAVLGKGLFMEKPIESIAPAGQSEDGIPEDCRGADRRMAVQTIHFPEDSALLDECTRKAALQFMGSSGDLLAKSIAQNLVNQACVEGSDGPSIADGAKVREQNVKAFVCVGSAVAKVADYMRFRLTLLGHSNNEGSNRFRSNYELSEARVRSTQLMLTQMFSGLGPSKKEPKNVDWLPLPMSSEPVFLESRQTAIRQVAQPSVEIDFQPILGDLTQLEMQRVKIGKGDLSLLDYMYFMIYTITTTGYGDIRPVSAQSKFICSLANLLEIFFLVVIFNTLSTLDKKYNGTAEKPEEVGV